MGLQEKAEKYIREKKDAALYALRQRDFSGIFSEDEKVISQLLRDLWDYTATGYAETGYLREMLRLLPIGEMINTSYENIEKKFASFFETVFKSEYFICYYLDGSKYIVSDVSKEKINNSALLQFITTPPDLNEEESIIEADRFFSESVLEKSKDINLDKAFVTSVSDNKKDSVFAVCVIGKKQDGVYTKHEKYFIKFVCLYMSYIYNSKFVFEDGENARYKLRYVKDSLSLIKFAERALQDGSNFCATLCQIDNFKISKKQYEDYSDILKQAEDVFSNSSVSEIVKLGFGFYAAVYSDKNKVKEYEDIFKNIKDEIKQKVLKTFSCNIQSFCYESGKFKNKSDFIASLAAYLTSFKSISLAKKKKTDSKEKVKTEEKKEIESSKKAVKKTVNKKIKTAKTNLKKKTGSISENSAKDSSSS